MYKAKECTLATAEALLESLSLPQLNRETEPFDLDTTHGQKLFSKLFDEKKNSKIAQKLMGVFICEAIRFQDDGALARMAMRKVISLFPRSSDPNLQIEPIESNPFYQVFVAGETSVVFAVKQGKKTTLDLFFTPPIGKDFSRLSAYIDVTSDIDESKDEDGSSQTTAFRFPKTPKSQRGRPQRLNPQFTFPDGKMKRKIKPKTGQTSMQHDQDESELLDSSKSSRDLTCKSDEKDYKEESSDKDK